MAGVVRARGGRHTNASAARRAVTRVWMHRAPPALALALIGQRGTQRHRPRCRGGAGRRRGSGSAARATPSSVARRKPRGNAQQHHRKRTVERVAARAQRGRALLDVLHGVGVGVGGGGAMAGAESPEKIASAVRGCPPMFLFLRHRDSPASARAATHPSRVRVSPRPAIAPCRVLAKTKRRSSLVLQVLPNNTRAFVFELSPPLLITTTRCARRSPAPGPPG